MHIIEGSRAYKDQWLESMASAKKQKNRRLERGSDK